MIAVLLLFGFAASEPFCRGLPGTSTIKYDLPEDILALNKIQFKGFVPVVTRKPSATGKAYMEITGYSTMPTVQIGDQMIISATCSDSNEEHSTTEEYGFLSQGARFAPSWFPLACTAVAMLPSGSRMVALLPMLAWAKGVGATAACQHMIKVTIYTPPPVDVARPGCVNQVAKNTTSDKIVGGTLYVFEPPNLDTGSKDWKKISGKSYVDLAEASIAAGCLPKHKPHMVHPSPDNSHTVITYTGDQDFVVLRNADYQVVQCPSVEHLKPRVFGGAVHQGAWYTNQAFLSADMTGCVDGTCGGAIHRHNFDYDGTGAMTGTTYVTSLGFAGVAAARNSTSGTKPIALGNNPNGNYSRFFFVTDAKGAGSILNAETMTWEKHFDVSEFGNCSGGGLWVEPHPDDAKIVVAQYGKQDGASCFFKINMETQELSLLAQLPDNADAHGIQFCNTTDGDWTVISTNRQTSTLDVINYADGSYLLRDYDINENVFDSINASWHSEGENRRLRGLRGQTDKLQPDVAYLHDGYLYMAARGPRPVSAVKKQNYRVNAHPGMMVLKIDPSTCLPDADQSKAFILTTLERSPEITSDVHGLWGVSNGGIPQIWAVDQAGTGSMQQYEVYSTCAAMGVDDSSIHEDPSPHAGD